MAEQMVLSFDRGVALEYLQTLFHLSAQRDELNDAIAEARDMARKNGVPTQAVEARCGPPGGGASRSSSHGNLPGSWTKPKRCL